MCRALLLYPKKCVFAIITISNTMIIPRGSVFLSLLTGKKNTREYDPQISRRPINNQLQILF